MMVNNYSKAVYFATPYAFTISLAYLFGYWSTFDINILEYISFTDVIKLSLYPLVVSLLSFIVGVIYSTVQQEVLKETTKERRKYKRIYLLLAISLGIIIVVADRYYLWFIGAVLFAILFSILLDRVISLDKLFPKFSPNIRHTIIFLLISLPLLAFASGKIDGKHIIIGHNTRFAKASILKENKLLSDQEKLKFVGLAGKYVLFLSEDNSMCFITTSQQIPILELSEPSYIELNLLRKWRKNRK